MPFGFGFVCRKRRPWYRGVKPAEQTTLYLSKIVANPAELVNNNLNGSGLQEFSVLYQTDAINFLDKLFDGDVMVTLDGKSIPFKLTHGFDIIFLDPPYNKGLLVKSLNKIYEYNLLSENGIIVAETETDGEDITSTGFDILKSSRYGKTVITVMQR